MISQALTTWRSKRTIRLDRLVAAHATVGGTGPGRRWLTDELNHALVLRLASEFQGFCRDLHDETAAAVTAAFAPGNAQRQEMLKIPYFKARRLNRGNADPGVLGYDFGLFDLNLWAELGQRHPVRGQQWRDRLTLLNTARNGLAHDNDDKIGEVTAAGWPPTLYSIRRWRSTLEGLTAGMDTVVCDYLGRKFGVRPW